MTDLTYLNAKYKNDLDFAVSRAEHYITMHNAKNNNQTVYESNFESEIITQIPLGAMKIAHDLIELVMYSSGYFCIITQKKLKKEYHYKITVKVMTMNDEDKKLLTIPEHARQTVDEDPSMD